MADIYQEIWTADQESNGIEPILDTEGGDQAEGFVKVNSDIDTSSDPDLKVLTEVHIPDNKKSTYDLCIKLFNNYALAERDLEHDTPEERQELHNFVDAILHTPPMQVARDYIDVMAGSTMTDHRWYSTVFEMWFRRFEMGGDPQLTGFEHIVVGEQQGSKVQGYHFWWKYFLDDGLATTIDDRSQFPGLNPDLIHYGGSKLSQGQTRFPESVTISFGWCAPDYDRQAIRPLFKKIGGFFVGCSVEGLLALGTVRAHLGANAPTQAVIEGARYDMKLFHSHNKQHIRTFYPVFLGEADTSQPTPSPSPSPTPIPRPGPKPISQQSSVSIVGAKVNPLGHDPGLETITLVNTGAHEQNIGGWSMADKNGNTHTFGDDILHAGEFKTVALSGQNVQLSNKGGSITLLDTDSNQVQKVSYSKKQAKAQGVTLLF